MDRNAFILHCQLVGKLFKNRSYGIVDPKDEGTTRLRNVGNYPPVEAAELPTRPDSSSAPLRETQIS